MALKPIQKWLCTSVAKPVSKYWGYHRQSRDVESTRYGKWQSNLRWEGLQSRRFCDSRDSQRIFLGGYQEGLGIMMLWGFWKVRCRSTTSRDQVSSAWMGNTLPAQEISKRPNPCISTRKPIRESSERLQITINPSKTAPNTAQIHPKLIRTSTDPILHFAHIENFESYTELWRPSPVSTWTGNQWSQGAPTLKNRQHGFVWNHLNGNFRPSGSHILGATPLTQPYLGLKIVGTSNKLLPEMAFLANHKSSSHNDLPYFETSTSPFENPANLPRPGGHLPVDQRLSVAGRLPAPKGHPEWCQRDLLGEQPRVRTRLVARRWMGSWKIYKWMMLIGVALFWRKPTILEMRRIQIDFFNLTNGMCGPVKLRPELVPGATMLVAICSLAPGRSTKRLNAGSKISVLFLCGCTNFWLVVWLPSIWHFPIHIGLRWSSQLTHIFQRGWNQPPTSKYMVNLWCMIVNAWLILKVSNGLYMGLKPPTSNLIF